MVWVWEVSIWAESLRVFEEPYTKYMVLSMSMYEKRTGDQSVDVNFSDEICGVTVFPDGVTPW